MLRFVFVFFLLTQTLFAKVVLIDPGHGGEEQGAIGKPHRSKINLEEKKLSLKLAFKLKEKLKNYPGISTYLTRSLDRTVSLQERADLADLIHADLFISLHFNSSTSSKGHGFEIYYLDNSSNLATRKVEKAENLNLKGEEFVVNQILVDLVIQQTVKHSKKLAKDVHQQIKPYLKKHKISDRGIKSGLFYVLALSKRPGLLIEGGFVSNPKELSRISSDKYLDDIATGIAKGIFQHLKNKISSSLI